MKKITMQTMINIIIILLLVVNIAIRLVKANQFNKFETDQLQINSTQKEYNDKNDSKWITQLNIDKMLGISNGLY